MVTNTPSSCFWLSGAFFVSVSPPRKRAPKPSPFGTLRLYGKLDAGDGTPISEHYIGFPFKMAVPRPLQKGRDTITDNLTSIPFEQAVAALGIGYRVEQLN